ncbi:DUF624 domain-containing protein [Niallia sp.]|uniref:DUF624 domain-containing protein n=1 Tax=Niallia sp. TaxID=2837523 RepID=UPI0028A07B44|nr:DUF624 domain-containing protein [Niallia sp.]
MNVMTKLTKWIYAIVRITIVWWVATIPYLYLLFSAIGAESVDQIGTLALTGWILIPFILVPGAIAALGVSREFLRSEEDKPSDLPLYLLFWKYYKREYVNALKTGVVWMLVLAVFYMAYSYYSIVLGGISGFIFLLFIFIAIFYFIFLLTILIDRSDSFIGYFKVTAQLMCRHPILIISMVFEAFLVIYLSATFMPSLLLFVCPGIIALLFTHFYRECLKQEEKKQTLLMKEC